MSAALLDEAPLDRDLGVQVWRVPLDGRFDARDWRLLSEEERVRAAAMLDRHRRVEWIQAHAAWRRILGRHLGCDPRRIGVKVTEHGALVVEPFIHQSLSHTDGMALVAIADRPVGIDVERIREVDVPSLARFFTDAERAEIAGRLPEFFRVWTAKEAWLKGLGVGLDRRLDSFAVSLADSRGIVWASPDRGEPARWKITELSVGAGFAATLATRDQVPSSVVVRTTKEKARCAS